MPLLPFRCTNDDCADQPGGLSQHDFIAEADSPVCPKCGADARTEEGSHVVHPLAVIHYLRIDKAGKVKTGNGRRSVACQPEATRLPTDRVQMTRGGPPRLQSNATGEPTAVTCPACKATDEWKTDYEAGNVQHMSIIKMPKAG